MPGQWVEIKSIIQTLLTNVSRQTHVSYQFIPQQLILFSWHMVSRDHFLFSPVNSFRANAKYFVIYFSRLHCAHNLTKKSTSPEHPLSGELRKINIFLIPYYADEGFYIFLSNTKLSNRNAFPVKVTRLLRVIWPFNTEPVCMLFFPPVNDVTVNSEQTKHFNLCEGDVCARKQCISADLTE